MKSRFSGEANQPSDTVGQDLWINFSLALAIIICIVIFWINPIVVQSDKINLQGNILIEVFWLDQFDTDVDLWVEGPIGLPVGYSNKGNEIMNLLRDDLGHVNDISNKNYEVIIVRGAPEGEYVINVHLYSNRGMIPTPMLVKLHVTIKKDQFSLAREVIKKEVKLNYLGHELTIVRFNLDKDGNLVPESIHDLQKKIRSKESPRRDPWGGTM